MTDIQSLPRDLREVGCCCRGDGHICVSCLAADEIEKLRREVAALKAAAEKGTEYVLAQINQDLRAERDAAVKALQVPTVKDSLTAQSRLDAAAFREERDEARALLNGVLQDIAQLEAERDAAVKAMSGWSGYGYRDGYYVDDIGEYFQPFIDAAKGGA